MRRPTLVGAVAAAVALSAAASAAPATAAPASAAPVQPEPTGGQLVHALVVLREQADLSAIRAGSRAQRLAAVEAVLRAKAASSQRGLLDLLGQRRAQHLATDITPLWIVNEVAVAATPAVLTELAHRPEVREVRPDLAVQAPRPRAVPGTAGPLTAVPEDTIARIGAPALWELGYRGQGVVVASLDTGVDGTHPDLAGRWRGGSNSWFDPNGEHPTTPTDVNGHGTQTMGVIVGGDAGGTSIGVAPGATWIAAKVFNDHGVATTTNVHRSFQWLLDPDGDPATTDAPSVVNDSWTLSASGCNLEFQPDLVGLRAAGILPVFSAGNYGPLAGTVFSPANNPAAFAVGGVDDADLVDPYSSRGPSACAGAVAPRLTAPGVDVRTSDLYGSYVSASGTSIAAPHVAGALALLLSAFPGLPADRQDSALKAGAVDLGPAGADADYGYGRLDVLAAYQWLADAPDFSVAVSPSSVTTAAGGTAAYSVSVTGTTGFAGDVALSLGGLAAAQGTGSFAPPVVTGTGTAQLTVVTAATLAPGSYPLTVTGTSGTLTRTASTTLVVPAPPDFALSASPLSRTVTRGQTASYTVSTSTTSGFTGSVTLSVSGLPTGTTATWSANPIGTPGSSTLRVRTTSRTPRGTVSLVVRGTSGTLTHSVPLKMVVK